MSTEIDSISISIKSGADSAVENVDKLVESLKNLRAALSGDMSRKAAELSDSLDKIAKNTSKASSNARKLKDDMANAAKDSGMEKVSSSMEKAAKSTSGLGSKLRSLREDLSSKFSAAAKKAKTHADEFWHSLSRIAGYRILRTIIKEITSAFKEGITNLYHYSDAVNGNFAKAMDSLATSTLYLKNALGTLVAPLIEALAPAIDFVVDRLVAAINLFNQFVAAIRGLDTYTAAKKYAVAWDDESKKATKSVKKSTAEIKRTILGFDELNVLNGDKNRSSGTGSTKGKTTPNYSAMFEERPVTGILKGLSGFSKDVQNITSGWPSWLKWLLGVGGVGLAAWGISKLPKLLKNILKGLKDLAFTNIPNWLKNLFGGKGGAGGGGIADGEYKLDVDLQKGDWEVLDELKNETALVKVGLQHWGWDNISDWIGNASTVHIGLRKWGWESISTWIGTYATVYVGLAHWGWTNIEDWIGEAVTVHVGLRRWGWKSLEDWIGDRIGVFVELFRYEWESIGDWIGESVYVKVGLRHWGWSHIEDWIGRAVTVSVGLRRWGWSSLQSWVGSEVTVKVNLTMANGGVINVRSTGTATGGGGSFAGGGAGRNRREKGGIFSALRGLWSSLPQYAGGTTNAHGSLFLAGENGPEIVGHVGGRTEILNRSQLASTMYSSVAHAMAPVAAALSRDYTVPDPSAIDYAALGNAVASALRAAGVGAVYLDGTMISSAINRETRRLGRPAVTM